MDGFNDDKVEKTTSDMVGSSRLNDRSKIEWQTNERAEMETIRIRSRIHNDRVQNLWKDPSVTFVSQNVVRSIHVLSKHNTALSNLIEV